MSAEVIEFVAEPRSSRRVLGAYLDGDRFHVADVVTGEVFSTLAGDPLVAVVRSAEALGLPWMRLEFNRHGERCEPGRPVVQLEADLLRDRLPRETPLQHRAAVVKQRKQRGRWLSRRPREFPPRVGSSLDPLPRPYTAAQEARFAEVYGPYWRSRDFDSDCAKLYGGKPRGYWGAMLDQRIADTWSAVLSSGRRSR